MQGLNTKIAALQIADETPFTIVDPFVAENAENIKQLTNEFDIVVQDFTMRSLENDNKEIAKVSKLERKDPLGEHLRYIDENTMLLKFARIRENFEFESPSKKFFGEDFVFTYNINKKEDVYGELRITRFLSDSKRKKEIACVPLMYDWFEDEHGLYLLIENVGKPVNSYFNDPEITFDGLKSIILQTLCNLETLQRKYEFCHNDLTDLNITLKQFSSKTYVFEREDGRKVDFDLSEVGLVQFIDFGFSRTKDFAAYEHTFISEGELPGTTVTYDIEPFAMNNFNAGVDVRIFMLYVLRGLKQSTLEMTEDERKWFGKLFDDALEMEAFKQIEWSTGPPPNPQKANPTLRMLALEKSFIVGYIEKNTAYSKAFTIGTQSESQVEKMQGGFERLWSMEKKEFIQITDQLIDSWALVPTENPYITTKLIDTYFTESTINSKLSSRCATCTSATNLSACADCNTTYYCSTKCQAADWKTHQVNCS